MIIPLPCCMTSCLATCYISHVYTSVHIDCIPRSALCRTLSYPGHAEEHCCTMWWLLDLRVRELNRIQQNILKHVGSEYHFIVFYGYAHGLMSNQSLGAREAMHFWGSTCLMMFTYCHFIAYMYEESHSRSPCGPLVATASKIIQSCGSDLGKCQTGVANDSLFGFQDWRFFRNISRCMSFHFIAYMY